ncbi:hypothetical protein ACPCBX_26095 [Streptomyces tuirus]|uniref:Uncharacterized protein n=1 Tax=Streptomyces tuirus TaxID=68278 RepID=A0A7G1NR13_9ACTN|nr:hypothetical protein [Streptomyces tuirus]BCL24931.1 hypothetical protein GCM10017668_67740 [Streptomyces tuirus]
MRHTVHAASAGGTTRPHSPVGAVLAVVVLAVLTTLGIAAPPPGTWGTGVTGVPVAADLHRYDGTRADTGCDAACAVRAATRHEQPQGEHPAARGLLGTCGESADTTPYRLPNPCGAPAEHVPSSQQNSARDRGRAPPGFSGT